MPDIRARRSTPLDPGPSFSVCAHAYRLGEIRTLQAARWNSLFCQNRFPIALAYARRRYGSRADRYGASNCNGGLNCFLGDARLTDETRVRGGSGW